MDRIQLKMEAKALAWQNNWAILRPTILQICISFVLSFVIGIFFNLIGLHDIVYYVGNTTVSLSYSDFFSSLLLIPMNFGIIMYLMNFEKQPYGPQDINIIYKPYKYFIKLIVITVFIDFLVTIGSTLFIIPGIIISCGFSAVPYVYMRHPELSIIDMLSHSWKMMKGHKMEFFILDISFIGWILLTAFTCFIAGWWSVPYIQITFVKYFNRIYEEYTAIPHTEVYE